MYPYGSVGCGSFDEPPPRLSDGAMIVNVVLDVFEVMVFVVLWASPIESGEGGLAILSGSSELAWWKVILFEVC